MIGNNEDPLPEAKGKRWQTASVQSWRWMIARSHNDESEPAEPDWFVRARDPSIQRHDAGPAEGLRQREPGPHVQRVGQALLILALPPSQLTTRASRLAAPYRRLPEEYQSLEWGDFRYIPSSSWNAEEETAYLTLKRRDHASQGLIVRVIDPLGKEDQTNPMGVSDQNVVVCYPRDFPSVSTPLQPGTYEVAWFGLQPPPDDVIGIVMPQIAEDRFRIP